MGLALRARLAAFYGRGSVGFDWDRAGQAIEIPAGFRLEAAVAIGRSRRRTQVAVN